MVSHLLNIDERLAKEVVDGLGTERNAQSRRRRKTDQRAETFSPALSIQLNGPKKLQRTQSRRASNRWRRDELIACA